MTFQRRLRNLMAALIGVFFKQIGLLDYGLRKVRKGCILPIFFHNPYGDRFKRLIEWLIQNNFRFISTEQLLNILNGTMELQERAVWISFDDGWRGNIEGVIPTLIAYNVPATFFLTTNPIESDMGVHWFSLARANSRYLPQPYKNNVEQLWSLPEKGRRKIVAEIENNLHLPLPRETMTVAEVQKIAKLPQVTIGCHSVHHGNLTNHTEAELESEVCVAKEKLEAWTGQEVKYFSFPRGIIEKRIDKYLNKYGYELAATTKEFIIDTKHVEKINVFRLPRHAVLDDGYFSEVICHALGIWQPIIHRIKPIVGLNPLMETFK